jgi:hypothetical protein
MEAPPMEIATERVAGADSPAIAFELNKRVASKGPARSHRRRATLRAARGAGRKLVLLLVILAGLFALQAAARAADDSVLSPDAVPSQPALSPDEMNAPPVGSPDAVPSQPALSPDEMNAPPVGSPDAVPPDPALSPENIQAPPVKEVDG